MGPTHITVGDPNLTHITVGVAGKAMLVHKMIRDIIKNDRALS